MINFYIITMAYVYSPVTTMNGKLYKIALNINHNNDFGLQSR